MDCKIMGILNVTPDSFSDGGRFNTIENAVAHALKMIEEGADIIDVGGESTKPGALPVTIEEECARVIPIIEILKSNTNIPLSIDTRHTKVMEAALNVGVNIINDVTALQDEKAIELVAAKQVPVCLMHMQGTPKTMQNAPAYYDVLAQIYEFLEDRIHHCFKKGILRENIWIDPGFGFGKTLEHNLTILGNLSYFKGLGCKLLVGLSRKSMLGQILNKATEERTVGTLSAEVLMALQGVDIIRTHEVAKTKDALKIVSAVKPYWQTSKNLSQC